MVHTFWFSCYNTINSKASRHHYQMHPPVCYWCAGAPRFTKVGILLKWFTRWTFFLCLNHVFGLIYFLSHYSPFNEEWRLTDWLIITSYSSMCPILWTNSDKFHLCDIYLNFNKFPLNFIIFFYNIQTKWMCWTYYPRH